MTHTYIIHIRKYPQICIIFFIVVVIKIGRYTKIVRYDHFKCKYLLFKCLNMN